MIIREYSEQDRGSFENLIVKLGEYIASIDPQKKNVVKDTYRKVYVDNIIKEVRENRGKILLAEEDGKVVGCISGLLVEEDEISKSFFIGVREGRVTELYLEEEYRGSNIAKTLMQEMENYFKESGCDRVCLEVFEPNHMAYRFYEKLGFVPRVITMRKEL